MNGCSGRSFILWHGGSLMPAEVVVPQMGITVTQGTINKWLRKEGDAVSQGDPLLEVVTEKVTTEIQSPADGVLAAVLYRERETVPVGTVVAVIATPGEEPARIKAQYQREVAAPGAAAAPQPAVAMKPSRDGTSSAERVLASPAARRLAGELGVDLSTVVGTGPGGRITEQDVRSAAQARGVRRATPLAEAMAASLGVDLATLKGTGPAGKITKEDVAGTAQAGGVQGGERVGTGKGETAEVRLPLEGRRRVIAERMTQSVRTTAAVTLAMWVDMTPCAELRKAVLPEIEARWGVRLTYTDVIVKAVAATLREFPALNASLVGEEIILHSQVNVGVAVDVEEGLIVPVIRDADKKGLGEIARDRVRLVEEARSGRISPDDLVGGKFTVTNLGSYGIEAFSPIINPPEAAILGVGSIHERPVAADGQVVARLTCCLSLVFDHRLVDGAPAARFLQRIRSLLENPYLLLV